MPINRDDLESAQGMLDRSLEGASAGEAILNELTKSYGFGRNEDGTWDWSVDRVVKSFQDSPLTTTLDYLSLAVPVLKWGKAVAAVKAGAELEALGGAALGVRANVAQKALEAGEFAGQTATSRMGRVVGRFFGDDVGKAAEVYNEGASPLVARLRTGRGTYRTLGFSSPIGTDLSDEYLSMLDRHGAEWWENRAVVKSLDRERTLEEAYSGRTISDVQKAYQGANFTDNQLRRAELFQRSRIAPDDPRLSRVLEGDPAKLEAYRQDFDFRMWLHGQLYDLGLTSADTYEAGLKKYGPNLSAEWERIKGAAQVLEPGVLRRVGRNLSEEGRSARLAAMTEPGSNSAFVVRRYGSTLESPGQGIYVSIVDHPKNFVSPHLETGDKLTLEGIARPQNPLVLEDAWIQHARFGRGGAGGPGSAGVVALKQLVSPAEFERLRTMSKRELAAEIADRFPGARTAGHDHDSYQLLEVYGAQEAKAAGHDALILRDRQDPNFSEAVVLDRSIIEQATKRGKAPVTGGAARLQRRAYSDAQFGELFDQVLDPRASLETLTGAAQLVARQRFAQGLAGSIVTKSSAELRDLAVEIASGNNPKLALLHGITPERLDAVQRLAGGLRRVGHELDAEENDLAVAFGWKKLDQMFEGAKVPGYLERLPEDLRNRWIDPAAAEDVVGGLEFMSKPEGFGKFYGQVVNLFRASKTAYNPATHVRNQLGNVIFASLARGGAVKLAPLEGLASWRAGDETYQAWREAIGAGASFDHEIRDAISESGIAATKAGKQATALDWLGQSTAARALQRGAGKLEDLYRAEDEIWSLDTWMGLTRKYEGQGHALEDARQLATRDLRKFMPNFSMQSDFGDILRKGIAGRQELAIPFASFTTESLRVWKNVLAERPHLAYMWNHIFESMGQTFGAMAGFNPQQLEEAKQALPEYQAGKKMLILPFNVDGQARFLDLSYMIPLANLAEAQGAESTFFGNLYDVTANPLLSTAIQATTGKDPFTGRDIEPTFTERQLGVPVTNPRARKLVGLAEHMAAMLLPPLVPPGYGGVNLLELARGQKNPATDQPLEDGVLATIASNLGGLRTYKADVESQVLNVRAEQRRSNEAMAQSWDRWEFARAQGDESAMASEQQRIMQLRLDQGYSANDAQKYFDDSAKKRGPLSNLSKRQKREIAARADRLGALSPEDEDLRQKLGRAP